jgi:phenylpyruvate tautomerase PptA (4-oxalocrotonate tautomerase family)
VKGTLKMNSPIIRLEIEGMKQTIMHAMTHHMAAMDSQINAAVERACTPEAITVLIEDVARKQIAAAVTSEVENFYRYGEGRRAIKAAVIATLAKDDEDGA